MNTLWAVAAELSDGRFTRKAPLTGVWFDPQPHDYPGQLAMYADDAVVPLGKRGQAVAAWLFVNGIKWTRIPGGTPEPHNDYDDLVLEWDGPVLTFEVSD